MTRYEKMSWFTLVFCLVSIAGFLILLPFAGILVASSMFAFLAVTAFAPLIYRQEEPLDERDRAILKRAQFGGHMIFWLFFVLVSMGTWGWHYYRGIEIITIQVLPLMVFWGMTVVITTQAVVTIILYRRGVGHGEN